jgi:hypothetical protein
MRQVLLIPVLGAVLAVPVAPRESRADAQPAPAREKARPRARVSPSPSPQASPAPRVFTDEDLPGSAEAARKAREKAAEQGPGKAQPSPAASATPTPEPTPAVETEEERAVEQDRVRRVQEESSWRQRMNEVRSILTATRSKITDLEERAERLAGEILMSTDTNQILRLRAEQRTVQEGIESAKADVVKAQQAITAVEEEARRKGIPRAWLEP